MAEKGAWERLLARFTEQGLPIPVQFVVVVLAAVGVVFGLIDGAKDLWDLKGPGWAKVLAWACVALVAGLVAALYHEQYRHRRELHSQLKAQARLAQVARALPDVHEAFRVLRDAAVMIRAGDSETAYRATIVRSLEHLAHAFSTVAGASCRSCIKELVATKGAPTEGEWDSAFYAVQTYERHDGTKGSEKDKPSRLYDNTDFRMILERSSEYQYFFSNDLLAERNHVDPHLSDDPAKNDYNAAIVWPIKKHLHGNQTDLFGFLCVDSKKTHVFDETDDFHLGAAFADTLYTVLTQHPVPVGTSKETPDAEGR